MDHKNITTGQGNDGKGPGPSKKRRWESEGDSLEGEDSVPPQLGAGAQPTGVQSRAKSQAKTARKRISVSSASASATARAKLVEERREIVLSGSDSDSEFRSTEGLKDSESEKENKAPAKRRGRGRPETTWQYRIKKAVQEAQQVRERLAREVEEHEKMFDETYSPALTKKLLLTKEEVVEEANAAAVYDMATAIEAQMAAIHRVAVTASNLKGTQVRALREAAVRAGVFATRGGLPSPPSVK